MVITPRTVVRVFNRGLYICAGCLIGVGARKFLGVQRMFAQTFPNLPKKVSCNFCRPFLWRGLQKMIFTCFFAYLGSHFSKSNNVGRHFCPDFQGFYLDIWGFCSDFQQIRTFRGALAPPEPPPPTPLGGLDIINFAKLYLFLVFHLSI